MSSRCSVSDRRGYDNLKRSLQLTMRQSCAAFSSLFSTLVVVVSADWQYYQRYEEKIYGLGGEGDKC